MLRFGHPAAVPHASATLNRDSSNESIHMGLGLSEIDDGERRWRTMTGIERYTGRRGHKSRGEAGSLEHRATPKPRSEECVNGSGSQLDTGRLMQKSNSLTPLLAEAPSSSNMGDATIFVTETVTVTDHDCSVAGECLDASLSILPSSSTINALTVLVSALASFTAPTATSEGEISNALPVLSEAQATNSPVPPLTFSPALLSSYGLTDVGTTSSPLQTGTAPLVPTTASATPILSSYGVVSSTVDTSAVSALTSSASPEASSEVVPGTTDATPGASSSTEVSPVSESSSVSVTTFVPIPIPSSDASSATSTAIPVSTESATQTTLTTATSTESAGAANSSPATTSSASSETANPVTGSQSPSVTGAAPTAANDGHRELPAALSGLAIAAAALILI
nr:hypothetical protein CFP56_69350 [Quercus suber]